MTSENTNKKDFKHRDDLTGEHALGDAGQVILALLFAGVWIADSFVFNFTTFLNSYITPWVRIPVGIVLLALAAYLAKVGLAVVFGEQRETPGVIRKSVFNTVRHPIYLSEILLYLGLLMLSVSLAAAVVWLAAIGFLHYISRHEEKLLLDRFGDAYRQYMQEVPMWFPWLKN